MLLQVGDLVHRLPEQFSLLSRCVCAHRQNPQALVELPLIHYRLLLLPASYRFVSPKPNIAPLPLWLHSDDKGGIARVLPPATQRGLSGSGTVSGSMAARMASGPFEVIRIEGRLEHRQVVNAGSAVWRSYHRSMQAFPKGHIRVLRDVFAPFPMLIAGRYCNSPGFTSRGRRMSSGLRASSLMGIQEAK